MNRPAPVPTLLQRQALATYLDTQRDAIYHAERRTHRVVVLAPSPVVPDQPEPCQFCAESEADSDLPLPMLIFNVVIGLTAWALFGWAVVTFAEALS